MTHPPYTYLPFSLPALSEICVHFRLGALEDNSLLSPRCVLLLILLVAIGVKQLRIRHCTSTLIQFVVDEVAMHVGS